MKRLALYILMSISFTAGAQSIAELNSMLSQSRSQFVTPDILDKVMFDMRKYETNPLPDQDSIVLDIYRSVSNSYVKYSHYKQGYQVFNRYLLYKEDILAKNKAAVIGTTLNSVAERGRNDAEDEKKLQNQLSEIKKDVSGYDGKLVFFKSNFSAAMIALSVVFAVILVGYGIRVFSLRSRLNQNRGTMKNIHRLALTGRYEEGVRNALQQSMGFVESEIAELKRVAPRS